MVTSASCGPEACSQPQGSNSEQKTNTPAPRPPHRSRSCFFKVEVCMRVHPSPSAHSFLSPAYNWKSSSLFLRIISSITSLGIISKPSSPNADSATPSFVALCCHCTAQNPWLFLFTHLPLPVDCMFLKVRDAVLFMFMFRVPSRVTTFYI